MSSVLIRVLRSRQFKVAILAGAKALPFVLEDVSPGPPFLESKQGEEIAENPGVMPRL